MANEEHLDILKQGVTQWNKWRANNQTIAPDLDGVNLFDADLAGVNLFEASLAAANLANADLSGADLTGTTLTDANLSDASLVGANLSRANLSGAVQFRANLSGSNLTGVKLYKADLSRANLSESNLSEANLISARFDAAILTGCLLWETQRSGWSIKNVDCEFVYFDRDGMERTDYQPGEFERLYGQANIILLQYENGISPIEISTLPIFIQQLQDDVNCSLRIRSIEEAGGGTKVTLVAENADNLELLAQKAKEIPTKQRTWSDIDLYDLMKEMFRAL